MYPGWPFWVDGDSFLVPVFKAFTTINNKVDLLTASVITLYLVHWSTQKMQPIIAKTAKTGTRIISHNFPMGDWTPSRVERFTDAEGVQHNLYLWMVEKGEPVSLESNSLDNFDGFRRQPSH